MKFLGRAIQTLLIIELTLGFASAVFADETTTETESDLNVTSGEVTQIVDGDTFKYCPTEDDPCTDEQWVEVDLWGVDAPELTPEEQFYAKKASQYLVDELLGQTVVLEEISAKDGGKPMVKVLIVNHPNSNFNVHLLMEGHGWSTTTEEDDAADVVAYREAEKYARTRKFGLWREIEPVAPWEWLQQRNDRQEPLPENDTPESE